MLKLVDDPSWTVRRQLAATVGELPQPARLDAAADASLSRYGGDPIIVDATVSGLRGSEAEVLDARDAVAAKHEADAVSMLAGAVREERQRRGGGAARGAARRTRRSRQRDRMAVLQGLDPGLPSAGGGRGGRGGGGGGGGRGRGAGASRWRSPPSRRR